MQIHKQHSTPAIIPKPVYKTVLIYTVLFIFTVLFLKSMYVFFYRNIILPYKFHHHYPRTFCVMAGEVALAALPLRRESVYDPSSCMNSKFYLPNLFKQDGGNF